MLLLVAAVDVAPLLLPLLSLLLHWLPPPPFFFVFFFWFLLFAWPVSFSYQLCQFGSRSVLQGGGKRGRTGVAKQGQVGHIALLLSS